MVFYSKGKKKAKKVVKIETKKVDIGSQKRKEMKKGEREEDQ